MTLLAFLVGCTSPAPLPAAEPTDVRARPSIKGNRLIAASDHVVGELEVSVTSPVAPGDTATATASATAGARCTIEVTYRSGPSEAQGLDPMTAGEDGAASWTWIVGINTTPGDWVVAVECVAPDGTAARGHARLSVAPVE